MLSFVLLFGFAKKTNAENYISEENSTVSKEGLFYFEHEKKDEDPVFTQILKWTGFEAALHYEISLKDENETFLFENKKVNTNELEVKLKPGTYFYKVYVYNFLEILEVESDWIEIKIKKAHIPKIQRLSPQTLYLEDSDWSLEVTGESFQSDANIYFISTDGERKHKIKPTNITDTKIIFDFVQPNVFLGTPYFLVIVDKSGLSDKSREFFVKYRKPIDLYVNGSYTPYLPLLNETYVHYFDEIFYPLSLTGELGMIFFKSPFGFFGIEARATFRKTHFYAEHIKLENTAFLCSANFLYEYWFSKKIAFSLTAGGGVAFNHLKTDFDTEAKMIDPMYSFGLGVRIKPVKSFYIDAGLYVDQFFNKDIFGMCIFPEIGFGYRY